MVTRIDFYIQFKDLTEVESVDFQVPQPRLLRVNEQWNKSEPLKR